MESKGVFYLKGITLPIYLCLPTRSVYLSNENNILLINMRTECHFTQVA